jgi:hypothetical protein
MDYLETIVVGLILLCAALYLHRTFSPKKKGGSGGCGCGTTDCKVPKVKIEQK